MTRGYGVPADSSYPSVLERQLRGEGYDVNIINAGVSGETTGDGVARLPRILAMKPEILVVAFGANDVLRGYPVHIARSNLHTIVRTARKHHAEVILAGLTPPGILPYFRSFTSMYRELATEHQVTYVPSLLAGVLLVPKLNLPDRLHPNAAGYRRVTATLLPYVRQRLELRGAVVAAAAR